MEFAKRWGRNPGFLLLLSSAAVLLICLAVFGAAFQGSNSETILSYPSLWFIGIIVLPFVLYLLTKLIWRRIDRIIR